MKVYYVQVVHDEDGSVVEFDAVSANCFLTREEAQAFVEKYGPSWAVPGYPDYTCHYVIEEGDITSIPKAVNDIDKLTEMLDKFIEDWCDVGVPRAERAFRDDFV